MTSPTDQTAARLSRIRGRALISIAAIVALILLSYFAYHWLHGRHFESTDNAYVQANVVQITPQIGGTVRAIHADDTDFVRAGQPLVSLDAADVRIALEQSQAQLAQTVREVRSLFAGHATLGAQIKVREADLARLKADLARARDDAQRRAPLLASGAVSKEELEHANAAVAATASAVASAESALQAAQDQLKTSQALTDGIDLREHPNVQRAASKLREAYLAKQRSVLPAPVDGWVARRNVQLGQRVQAGAPLMAVVALGQPWIDANFKESQLAKLRIGQPVTIAVDQYEGIEFHGKVAGLGAGTGAAFSILPAQNATGNWIKIVQRVPVRIELDAREVAEHPLRVGLSSLVTVDVSTQSGQALSAAGRAASSAQTAVFDRVEQEADQEVERIIRMHSGQAGQHARQGK
jgi:membrane fusion protein (multidrug efflux system)